MTAGFVEQHPTAAFADHRGDRARRSWTGQKFGERTLGCLASNVGHVVLVEEFEAHGMADRFTPCLHARIAVGDTGDGEPGLDLVVASKQTVAVGDLNTTPDVSVTDRHL